MAGAVFGLSTFSVRPWADTFNPGGLARRRNGSRFSYAPSAAIAASLCFVRTFTDEYLHYRRKQSGDKSMACTCNIKKKCSAAGIT